MENKNPDLSISVADTVLNIRVVILLNTLAGYVFEKSKDGYFFALGGRVKLQETTLEACTRELLEETNLVGLPLQMVGVVENFFALDGTKKYHEINFVFKGNLSGTVKLDNLTSDNGNAGYVNIKPEDFRNYDIRPKALLEVISTDKPFLHVVNKE